MTINPKILKEARVISRREKRRNPVARTLKEVYLALSRSARTKHATRLRAA